MNSHYVNIVLNGEPIAIGIHQVDIYGNKTIKLKCEIEYESK